MKLLEDKLEALDEYFAPKKESEKWVVILGVAGFIGYLGYSLLLPYTEDLHKKSVQTKTKLSKSIGDKSTYLKSITVGGDSDYYIHKFDNDIKFKNKKIVNLKDKITFVDSNLEKLSDLLYNQKSWSIFLNSITSKARVHHVFLTYLENKATTSKESFGHVLEIELGCKGDYKNIIKFINEIEQNVLVTDIFETEFLLDKESSDIVANIKISVWGINH